METITKTVNKNVRVDAGPTKEELRAQIQSNLDCLDKLISELEHPRYRELIRFAVIWKELDHHLSVLERALREPSVRKPINRLDELLKELIKKN